MNGNLATYLASILLASAAAGVPSVLETPCQPEIQLPQALLPAGSEMVSSTLPPKRLALVSIEISDGHPREKAFLVPSRRTSGSGESVVVFDLGPGRSPWISCSYSDGEKHIKFTRRLGPASRCEGTFVPGKGRSFSCT